MNLTFEIEWRELLLKRLEETFASLRRDATNERRQMTIAAKKAAGFEDYEEAHEAYGWGDITELQLQNIERILQKSKKTACELATDKLRHMVENVAGEISMLKKDPDFRKEVMQTDIEDEK